MEHRFTIKDLFLFISLSGLFVTLLLAMYMIDRQWEKLALMQATMHEQATDLRSLKSLVNSIDQRVQQRSVLTYSSTDSKVERIPTAFKRAFEASTKPEFSSGDWLVQAFGVNLKSLTPFISEDAYASEIQAYILESLLTRNPATLAWEGLVAKSWQISPNGLDISFQLRSEAKFSDGHPIEASDIVFSFNFIMDDAIRAPRERAYYNKIKSVETKTKDQVVFHFKEPYFNALALAGGLPILAEHFYAPYLKTPNTFNQSKGLLLGSGPYRLPDSKDWTPDKGMVELERNPRYWGSVQPSLDRLLWRVIENDSARLTTFRNGDIDVYSARPREYKKLKKDSELASRTIQMEYLSPVGGYSYIGWNQKRKDKATRFADVRVRQALTYLTDRKRIIDEIFLGYAEPAIGPFNPQGRQHNVDLKARKFDLKKAQQLLKEAGYEDRNGDGVLEDKHGKAFEFDLIYVQSSKDAQDLALFLKDLYARAGILLTPKPTEWSVMLGLIKSRDFDSITLGWTGSVESDMYQIFHSSQIADGGNNNVSYQNENLDRLIEQARATVDEDKRMPLWQKAEAILFEDQPYTFLVRRKSLVFIDNRIHNLQKTKAGLNLNIVPVEVYVPKQKQKYQG